MRVFKYSVWVIALILCSYILFNSYINTSSQIAAGKNTNDYVTISNTTSQGTPKIGGAFKLIDHNGAIVTDKSFRGQYMLVYFGYTYCPDICPTALHNVTQAINLLPRNKRNRLTPLFISVDPQRDDTKQLKLYRQNFHEKFVMLTGDEKAIKSAARHYKATYQKQEPKLNDDQDNYVIDHSSIVYVMDPNGKYVTHLGHDTDPTIIAKALRKIL